MCKFGLTTARISPQLVEQHSSEALNYLLRRLLLACAPTTGAGHSTGPATSSGAANASTTGSVGTTQSSASSLTSAASVARDASSGAGNAPSPAQLPLFLRLLQHESKRLASDPLSVDKFTSAFLSGLNDPSASTVDTFRAIDLPALLDKLSLSSFERTLLLLEFAQFILPETAVGPKSASTAAASKRREVAELAIRTFLQASSAGILTPDELISAINAAGLGSEASAKLVARLGSQIAVDIQTGEADYAPPSPPNRPVTLFPPTQFVREFVHRLEHVFAPDTVDDILCDAISRVNAPSRPDAQARTEAISTFLHLADLLIASPQHASTRAVNGLMNAASISDIFAKATPSSSSETLQRTLADILADLLQDPRAHFVQGQSLVQALAQQAREAGPRYAMDWSAAIRNLPLEVRQGAVPSENAGLLATLFSAQLETGTGSELHLVDILFEKFPSSTLHAYLLDFLINHQFDFAVHRPDTPKLVSLESLAAASKELELGDDTVANIGEQIQQVETLGWNHASLAATLFRLGETSTEEMIFDIPEAVRALLDRGNQTAPELIFLAILKSQVRQTCTVKASQSTMNFRADRDLISRGCQYSRRSRGRLSDKTSLADSWRTSWRVLSPAVRSHSSASSFTTETC